MKGEDVAVVATLLGFAALALYLVSTKTTVGQVVAKVEGELGTGIQNAIYQPQGSVEEITTTSKHFNPTFAERQAWKKGTAALITDEEISTLDSIKHKHRRTSDVATPGSDAQVSV